MLDFDHTTLAEFRDFGRWLWQRADHYATHEEVSQFIAETLFSEFVLNGDPQLALVRIFRLVYAPELPPDLLQTMDPAEQAALVLTGTCGIEDSWCSRHSSQRHKAVPFSRLASSVEFPMFTEVLGQMGVDLQLLSEGMRLEMSDYMGTYYIPEAPRCTAFPSQKSFIEPYGIQSAVGFGGFIYDLGSEITLYLLSAFSRVPITPEAAERFFVIQPFVGAALASQPESIGVFRG